MWRYIVNVVRIYCFLLVSWKPQCKYVFYRISRLFHLSKLVFKLVLSSQPCSWHGFAVSALAVGLDANAFIILYAKMSCREVHMVVQIFYINLVTFYNSENQFEVLNFYKMCAVCFGQNNLLFNDSVVSSDDSLVVMTWHLLVILILSGP